MRRQELSGSVQRRGRFVKDRVIGLEDVGPSRLCCSRGCRCTHGFHISFYVLAALAAAGALISVLMLESRPAQPELQLTSEAFELEQA